jgi:hypothetical protein
VYVRGGHAGFELLLQEAKVSIRPTKISGFIV